MDIEHRLRRLEAQYRGALSAAVAAKANYLALEGERSSTESSIARAREQWQKYEARKRAIAERMDELEDQTESTTG